MENSAYSVGYSLGVSLAVGIFGLLSFGFYKFLNWIAKKIDARSLWKKGDDYSIKRLLREIYACKSVKALNETFNEIKCSQTRHLKIAQIAFDQCYSSITSEKTDNLLNIREIKARRKWLIGLAAINFLSIFNIFYYLSTSTIDFNNPYAAKILMAYSLAYLIFSTGIVYRSAYSRKETGWLTLSITMSMFFLLVMIINTDALMESLKSNSEKTALILPYIGLVVNALYLFCCMSLRKINYQIKMRNKLENLKSDLVSPS